MFGRSKRDKKEKIAGKKRMQDMDDFELVGAEYETLDEYYKINEKIEGVMLVGSIASKAILIGGIFGLFSFFGAFSGNVKNIIDLLVPISMLGGLAGRAYFYSKEDEVDKLIDEADGLEQEAGNYKEELERRCNEYENEKNAREIFPELRKDEWTDEELESLPPPEGVEDKWLM